MRCAGWSGKGAGDGRLSGIVGSMPLEQGAAVASDLESFAALPHGRGIRRLIQGPAVRLGPAARLRGRRPAAGTLRPAVRSLHPAWADGRGAGPRPALSGGAVRARPHRQARHRCSACSSHGARRCEDLAREPNVWCKISGVVTEADHRGWRAEDIEPYVAHALDCFGFHRCMFGGDWPVSTLATTYRDWVLDNRIVAGATSAERIALYRSTAIDFYALAPDVRKT